jgi:hypothetical protein
VHDGEGVVQLVRDAGEERAHGGHLLALQEPLGTLLDGGLERAIMLLQIEMQPAGLQ